MELQSVTAFVTRTVPFTRQQSRLTQKQRNTRNEANDKNLLEQNSEVLCIQHNNKNIHLTILQI